MSDVSYTSCPLVTEIVPNDKRALLLLLVRHHGAESESNTCLMRSNLMPPKRRKIFTAYSIYRLESPYLQSESLEVLTVTTSPLTKRPPRNSGRYQYAGLELLIFRQPSRCKSAQSILAVLSTNVGFAVGRGITLRRLSSSR